MLNIPQAAARALKIRPGDMVKISLGDSVLTIEPMPFNRSQDSNEAQGQPMTVSTTTP